MGIREKFVDHVRIRVLGGAGGDGIRSFRREKFVPRGGPDGGNGGNGGDVTVVGRESVDDLHLLHRGNVYRAEAGGDGGNGRKHGRNGADRRLEVPVGTEVRSDEGEIIADLMEDGDEVVIGRGGTGGFGNAHFTTSTRQAPEIAERGEPGEERIIELNMRLIADVGIAGLPNAGKSTLLAALTAARPKIGEYAFTTISPNLGVLEFDDHLLKLADIPGLIEGAHEGAGLGHDFLRHIQRTRVLLHVLDGSLDAPQERLEAINREMALFDPILAEKPQIVVINKIDLPRTAELRALYGEELAVKGADVVEVSAQTGEGVSGLVELLDARVKEAKALEPAVPKRSIVLRPRPAQERFEISRLGDLYEVRGSKVERAARRTDFSKSESIAFFHLALDRMGVTRALAEAGAKSGSTVRIAGVELEWQ